MEEQRYEPGKSSNDSTWHPAHDNHTVNPHHGLNRYRVPIGKVHRWELGAQDKRKVAKYAHGMASGGKFPLFTASPHNNDYRSYKNHNVDAVHSAERHVPLKKGSKLSYLKVDNGHHRLAAWKALGHTHVDVAAHPSHDKFIRALGGTKVGKGGDIRHVRKTKLESAMHENRPNNKGDLWIGRIPLVHGYRQHSQANEAGAPLKFTHQTTHHVVTISRSTEDGPGNTEGRAWRLEHRGRAVHYGRGASTLHSALTKVHTPQALEKRKMVIPAKRHVDRDLRRSHIMRDNKRMEDVAEAHDTRRERWACGVCGMGHYGNKEAKMPACKDCGELRGTTQADVDKRIIMKWGRHYDTNAKYNVKPKRKVRELFEPDDPADNTRNRLEKRGWSELPEMRKKNHGTETYTTLHFHKDPKFAAHHFEVHANGSWQHYKAPVDKVTGKIIHGSHQLQGSGHGEHDLHPYLAQGHGDPPPKQPRPSNKPKEPDAKKYGTFTRSLMTRKHKGLMSRLMGDSRLENKDGIGGDDGDNFDPGGGGDGMPSPYQLNLSTQTGVDDPVQGKSDTTSIDGTGGSKANHTNYNKPKST